ncbi:sugar ABC transporter substrate-binding protein [Demequina lignilytica]|uniref:Extracellular solute-binding protein n=1 Tax=Demequina lignilytica TaxID=3051663 RepID=A0AAW7MAJ4_9MICO|nr:MULTISPECIES: extracellular solute-binding protein [unclassified Demequina]MDN4479101.1 extracellular solute-binding protein [Demequina sp. SYSU T00039-1]MDN4482539.1 extracellular solute-binding protein [Demequina sp. SYSU T0a273]MDN4489186.1 extracellular solute-binding protein [Demequina sp. SYSU T00039]
MRKKIGMAAAMATTVALLAACSSGGSTEETSSPAASETTPAMSGGELTIWVDENREPAVAAAAETFEAETGATVTLIQKNFEDIRADFLAQVPTGEGPDITIGAHDWLGALVEGGVVNTVDLGANASSFAQVGLDAMSYDGQQYGMPYALEAIALVQNVDLVGEEAPATWDEMIQNGIDSGAERPFCITTNGEVGDGYNMYPFQTSFGAPVFVQEGGSYTSEVGMGGDAGTAFATWLSENGEAGEGYLSTTIDYAINNELFNSGKCAYTIQGPWALGDFTDVNFVVNPAPSAGGETAAPFVGVQGFYVSSQSANALLANEFLTNYVATTEAMQALYDADPRLPAFEGVDTASAPYPDAIAGFQASAENGVPMPNIPEMGQVWDFWNAAESAIIKGADPEATWTKMVDDLTAALAG